MYQVLYNPAANTVVEKTFNFVVTDPNELKSTTYLVIGGLNPWYQGCGTYTQFKVKNYYNPWYLEYNTDLSSNFFLKNSYFFDRFSSNAAYDLVNTQYNAFSYVNNVTSELSLGDHGALMNTTTKVKVVRWNFFDRNSFTIKMSFIVTSISNCNNFLLAKYASDNVIKFGIYIDKTTAMISVMSDLLPSGTQTSMQVALNTPTTLIFTFVKLNSIFYLGIYNGSFSAGLSLASILSSDAGDTSQEIYIGDGQCSFTGTLKNFRMYEGVSQIFSGDCKSANCRFNFGNLTNPICIDDTSTTCSGSTYLDSFYECTDCNSDCLTCSSRSVCTLCKPNYYSLNFKCYSVCPFLYKANQTTKACDPDPEYCISNSNCTLSEKPHCLESNSTCEACLIDSDCADNFKCGNYTCMKCYQDSHCPGQYCFNMNACVDCYLDNHCPNGQVCNNNQCVDCYQNSHCNTIAHPNFLCNTTSNQCQKCLGNANCPALTPVCSAGDCYQCFQSSDCASRPLTSACKTDTTTCVECLSHSDCFGVKKFCDGTRNLCVECYLDNQCLSPKNHCNITINTCHECLNDSHCIGTLEQPQFCSNQYSCLNTTLIELFGPSLINAETDIIYSYKMTTNLNRYDYNLTWSLTTSALNSQKVQLIQNLFSETIKTSVQIPYFYLEAGAEYNISISYSDIYGFIIIKTVQTLPRCPIEKYLKIGQGCLGTCLRGCFVCDNPLTCQECAPFAILNQTTLGCDMESTISISSAERMSSNSANLLIANIDEKELGYTKISFDWRISSNETIWTNTSNFFSRQKQIFILIPARLLKANSSYVFHVSYVNYVGVLVSTEIFKFIEIENVPIAQIDGGSLQVLKRDVDNSIRLFYPDSMESFGTFTVIWKQIQGPKLALSQPIKNPSLMVIPACSLKEETTYKFDLTYFISSFDSMNSIQFTGKALFDSFTVKIINGNRTHPFSSDMTLESYVDFDNNCPDIDNSALQYLWTCTNYTTSELRNCSDPSNIFNIYSPSASSITIPKSHLARGLYYFTLSVAKGSFISQASSEITVSNQESLILEIKCLTSTCTRYYSNQTPLPLYADVIGLDSSQYNFLNFTWTMTPSLSYVALGNRFFLRENFTNDAGISLKIAVLVSNSTHRGECFITLKYNFPPSPGNLSIYPSVGEALSTNFLLSSINWLDTDAPIKYQYFYQAEGDDVQVWKMLGDQRLHPDMNTLLPASAPSQNLRIRVTVTDVYGASNSLVTMALVTNQDSSFNSFQSKIQALLANSPSYDSSQMTKSLSLISSQMTIIENINMNSSQGCPLCSGHGKCNQANPFCVCDLDWAGIDCSVSKSIYDMLLATKIDIIARFADQITNTSDSALKSMTLSSLKDLTTNPSFNNATTIDATEKMLQSNLKILSNQTIIEKEQKKTVVELLTNLIEYKSSSDCSCRLQSCQKYATELSSYFNKLSSDEDKTLSLGAPSVDYSTSVFDFSTRQVSVCNVVETDLINPSSNQIIRLSEIRNFERDCSQIVIIKTFAMQDQSSLFNCDSGSSQLKAKSKIGISVTLYPSGEDISNEYTLQIKNPSSKECPSSCYSELKDSILLCKCSKIGEFNPSSQISSIFKASQLGTLLKVDALLNWNPALSPVFWVEAFIVGWFVLTFILLGSPKYKNMSAEHLLIDPSVKKVVLYNFLVENQVLAIYYVEEKDLSKKMRLSIYFMKVLLLGLFNAIFGNAFGDSSALEMIINLQILIILLPYWTMLPINIIATILIKKSLKESINNQKSSKLYKISVKAILGLIIVAIIFATFVITVNNDTNWEIKWLTTIMINIFVEIFISPWIKVIITFMIYYISVVRVSKPVEGLKLAKTKKKIFPETKEQINALKTIIHDSPYFSPKNNDEHTRFENDRDQYETRDNQNVTIKMNEFNKTYEIAKQNDENSLKSARNQMNYFENLEIENLNQPEM